MTWQGLSCTFIIDHAAHRVLQMRDFMTLRWSVKEERLFTGKAGLKVTVGKNNKKIVFFTKRSSLLKVNLDD